VPLQVTSCGEAAHPDRARSLRKALLEFCGSRSRKAATHGPIDAVRRVMPRDYVERQMAVAMLGEEEPRALEAMAEWVGQDGAELRRRLSGSVFAERRRVRLSELPTTPPEDVARGEDRLNLLAGRLAGEGLEILYVDCSPAGSPVRVVKTIVPGLESETMSYHRIGWRGVRRLRERGDTLLLDGPHEGALRVRLRPRTRRRPAAPPGSMPRWRTAWWPGSIRCTGKRAVLRAAPAAAQAGVRPDAALRLQHQWRGEPPAGRRRRDHRGGRLRRRRADARPPPPRSDGGRLGWRGRRRWRASSAHGGSAA
jgi:hypothetical protein